MAARAGAKGTQSPSHRKGPKTKNAVVINNQILEAAEKYDLDELLWVIRVHQSNMNLVNLSTALHRIAKISCNKLSNQAQAEFVHCPSICGLLDRILNALQKSSSGQVKPQSVSNILWALASMQVVHRSIIELCMRISEETLASFKPFELSTTLWALAKLRTFKPANFPSIKAMLDAAAVHLEHQAEYFEFRCLSMVVWAYVTSQEINLQLFQLLATQLCLKASRGCGQELSLTSWAFGSVGLGHIQLFEALSAQALRQIDTFKPQELSNLVWGCAAGGFFNYELFAAVLAAAQQKRLGSQHLANILWAFTRSTPDSELTRQAHLILLPRCMEQFGDFKAQEVASIALSTAKSFGRDSLRTQTTRTSCTRPARDTLAYPPPHIVSVFFKQLAQYILVTKQLVPTHVLATVVENYSRVCKLPLEDEDSDFFLAMVTELVRRIPNVATDLLIRFFELLTLGDLAEVNGKATVTVPLAGYLAQCLNSDSSKDAPSAPEQEHFVDMTMQRSDSEEQTSTTGKTTSETSQEFGSGASEEKDSAQPTDEFGSDSLPSEGFDYDHLLFAEDSTSPFSKSDGSGNEPMRCTLKNTFLHFNSCDDNDGGKPRRRSSSLPPFFLKSRSTES